MPFGAASLLYVDAPLLIEKSSKRLHKLSRKRVGRFKRTIATLSPPEFQDVMGKEMKNRIALSAALAVALASSAFSQEIVLGAGYSDYSRQGAEDGVILSMEYIHRPFYEGRVFSARLAGAIELVETGDAFLGGGVSGKWDLQQDWFIEASVLPGAYIEGTALNDLGSTFEIRSQLAVGKRFKSGKALSLALSHKSNASTADINPGVNALTLRWHIPLD